MAARRRPIVGPGSSPLADKRALYIRLMKQGETNAAACRTVGIHIKTGYRWLHGRTETSPDGRAKVYPSIMAPIRAVSDRFLSEAERVAIADGLIARRSLRSIAAEIGRSPSTVSREIRRNRHPRRIDTYPSVLIGGPPLAEPDPSFESWPSTPSCAPSWLGTSMHTGAQSRSAPG